MKLQYTYNDGHNCSIHDKKQSCDLIVTLRRYGYLCNDTVITSANKLRDVQCKFANVRMAMKDMCRTE